MVRNAEREALRVRQEAELRAFTVKQRLELEEFNRGRCVECDQEAAELSSDGLCRTCFDDLVTEHKGSPTAAYIQGFGS